MAIQHRRGVYSQFDPSRLLPGEWAVVLSGDKAGPTGKGVYICFAAGDTHRMVTLEEFEGLLKDAEGEIVAELSQGVGEAIEAAESAAEELLRRADEGEFDGEKGDEGPQGPPGKAGPQGPPGPKGEDGDASAVVNLGEGYFAVSVNEEGHLLLTHNDNEPAPPLSIRDGRLIYTID